MPDFRRRYEAGGTYFFTVVTHKRRPILTTELGRRALREAIAGEQERMPFELVASVLLPDHLHAIWRLPEGDDAYPLRWKRIKGDFTAAFLAGGGSEVEVSPARMRKGDRGIWQPRYWEHTIRDEDDFSRCLDYIHWNPVKHGLVSMPADYSLSSFKKFVALGDYGSLWRSGEVNAEIAGAEWD